LARLDDTILDTQVLNDGTPFFLQFTELDYGTYDYKLLLSKWTTTSTSNPNISPESYFVDTVIATHTQLFLRPEPTFTTSWTKSGLTINADLSSITGAHSEFYAYLCRDDETTLATHQFTEGETNTSLTFTETGYGTFTYQLKLGTTEVSTHTETYVRPTPTYTASFSTNELTLTASITSITNAHNSFAITLERDDGTVLQTHTLADGETSFTFTQTETSYATFNYVVKLNGTQTDTYSATYTPPPTPTFDIALTKDDLAITATLTNIVNPDPYYTFMIHDASDAHLDGHTFTTGDTTVTLTWTETLYGEKTYTKLLNGASIGTETITLTDPNAIELRQDFTITGGAWINESVVKETGGTNNTNGSNADNNGWDTTYPSPWNTVVDKYSWSIVGHYNHKILYDPTQPTNSGQGWMYLDAINGGWTSSITNGVVKFQRNSDNWYIQWNVAGAWVNEAPSSNTPSTPTWTFTWDATNPSVPDGGTMEITYDGTNWYINDDSLEPDFATHATISATAVANSIAIGYYDFGAWVNGWSFPNTYTSGDVPASVISGSWASSFVSMIQQGSSSTPTQPTLITSISLIGGVWNPASYIHQATNNTNTYYEYKISLDTADSQYFIAYNWTTKKWFDTNTTTTHSTFGTSVSDTSSTSRETTENAAVVYVMASYALHPQFTNPYYEA
jgi:hypothetical protein